MNPANVAIGTRYGVKGKYWKAGYHTGVDYLTPIGTTLVAPADSKIIHAGGGGWGSAYGIHVIGESRLSGKTYRWITAHMSRVSVKPGQQVAAGDTLGKSGDTGNVTGPHTHLELRRSPFGYWDHLNPQPLIDAQKDWFSMATEAQLRKIVREEVERLIKFDAVPIYEPTRTKEHLARDKTAKVGSVLGSTLSKVDRILELLEGDKPAPKA